MSVDNSFDNFETYIIAGTSVGMTISLTSLGFIGYYRQEWKPKIPGNVGKYSIYGIICYFFTFVFIFGMFSDAIYSQVIPVGRLVIWQGFTGIFYFAAKGLTWSVVWLRLSSLSTLSGNKKTSTSSKVFTIGKIIGGIALLISTSLLGYHVITRPEGDDGQLSWFLMICVIIATAGGFKGVSIKSSKVNIVLATDADKSLLATKNVKYNGITTLILFPTILVFLANIFGFIFPDTTNLEIPEYVQILLVVDLICSQIGIVLYFEFAASFYFRTKSFVGLKAHTGYNDSSVEQKMEEMMQHEAKEEQNKQSLAAE